MKDKEFYEDLVEIMENKPIYFMCLHTIMVEENSPELLSYEQIGATAMLLSKEKLLGFLGLSESEKLEMVKSIYNTSSETFYEL